MENRNKIFFLLFVGLFLIQVSQAQGYSHWPTCTDSLLVREILGSSSIPFESWKDIPTWVRRMEKRSHSFKEARIRNVRNYETDLIEFRGYGPSRIFVGGNGDRNRGYFVVFGPNVSNRVFLYSKIEGRYITYNFSFSPKKIDELTLECPTKEMLLMDLAKSYPRAILIKEF